MIIPFDKRHIQRVLLIDVVCNNRAIWFICHFVGILNEMLKRAVCQLGITAYL